MIKDIAKNYKLKLIITYILFLVENVLAISYPYLFGNFINYIITDEYSKLYILPLALIAFVGTSIFRMMFDTRTFSEIYRDIASNLIVRLKKESVPTTKISARVNLSSSLVTFFESDLPRIIYMLFALGGGLYFIFLLDTNVGFLAILAVTIIGLIGWKFSKKIGKHTKAINDLHEREIENIESQPNPGHLYKIQKILQVKYSDASAINTLYNDLVIYSFIIVGILLYISTNDILLAGTALSMYQYMLKVVNGVSQLPSSISQYANLKDVLNRIKK